MAKKVSMKDIAEKMGTSVSTVSRVLNGKPGISDIMRDKVLQELKSANLGLRSTGYSSKIIKHKSIGIIQRQRSPSQGSGYEAFHIDMHGFQVSIIPIDDYSIKDPGSVYALKEKICDGFILRGQSLPLEFIDKLRDDGFPLVILENDLSGQGYNCVLSRDEEAVSEMTDHLLAHGRKNILFLNGPPQWMSNKNREKGYMTSMLRHGLNPGVIRIGDTTINAGHEAVENILKKHPEADGIICVNDAAAIGVLNALRSRGVEAGSVAVTGFDNIEWSSHCYPSLTTVDTHVEQLNRMAASRLLELMCFPNAAQAVSVVKPEILFRESCGCKG